jgi:hypothetical protein
MYNYLLQAQSKVYMPAGLSAATVSLSNQKVKLREVPP